MKVCVSNCYLSGRKLFTCKSSYAAIHIRMAITRDGDCSGPRKSFFNNSLVPYALSSSRKETAVFIRKLFKQTVFLVSENELEC